MYLDIESIQQHDEVMAPLHELLAMTLHAAKGMETKQCSLYICYLRGRFTGYQHLYYTMNCG